MKSIVQFRKAALQLCLFAFLMLINLEFTYAQENKLFNPAAVKQKLGLPQTKVMVLGISHLDATSAKFQTAWLEPLLCRLRFYNPQVILTEALSGEQVMGLDAYAAYHGDAGKYAGPTLEMAKTAQTELHMSAAQALVKADSLAQKRSKSRSAKASGGFICSGSRTFLSHGSMDASWYRRPNRAGWCFGFIG